MNNTYNGYTNKSTWSFMLWINNDPLMYGIAQGIIKGNKSNIEKISTDLKEFAEYLVNRDARINPKEITFSKDLKSFNGSLDKINYKEIAEHLNEDME